MVEGAGQIVGGIEGIGTVTLTVLGTGLAAAGRFVCGGGAHCGGKGLPIWASRINGTPHIITIKLHTALSNLMASFLSL